MDERSPLVQSHLQVHNIYWTFYLNNVYNLGYFIVEKKVFNRCTQTFDGVYQSTENGTGLLLFSLDRWRE
jgi:hypothetical protein